VNRVLPTLVWREIESLFFSPLAYIVMTIFLVLNGINFYTALEQSAGVVDETIAMFLGNGINFWLSLLIVPALVTMRLVAEERRSGQLEVLLTAPVRERDVVLAKFLGAMVFQVFLWAPTLIYIAILRNYGALPDAGQLLTAYLGIVAVTALLTSLGLLYSTLTTNQIVAAVASLTTNLLLFLVPLSLSGSQSFAPFGPALEQISMVHHFAGSFSRGILDSGHLAWYAAGTLGSLAIASRSLEARKWR
jgi:ABC-2 type transport system permease protein